MSIMYNLFLTSWFLHLAHMASVVSWSFFSCIQALIFLKRQIIRYIIRRTGVIGNLETGY